MITGIEHTAIAAADIVALADCGTITVAGMTADVQVTDAAGNVIRDTRAERIAR